MKSTEPEPEPMPSPTTCPFCRSAKISTPSERVDASTYWRCEACGQMWNVGRHTASQRPSYGRRWNNDY
jgi:transposase-like protein